MTNEMKMRNPYLLTSFLISARVARRLWKTVMFSFRDGAYAWETKDFLVEQERVEDVQLKQKTDKGRYAEEESSDG